MWTVCTPRRTCRPTSGALGADFYVTSAYKWSGPHIAACVADPQRWEGLRPEKLMPSPDVVPDRFEHGTLSFELLAGVTGAVDHLADLAGARWDRGASACSHRWRPRTRTRWSCSRPSSPA